MNFEAPTTYQQLLEVLTDIGDYYLDRREEYVEPVFAEMNLNTIVFTPKTDQELQVEAEQYYFNEYNKKIQERTLDLTEKLQQKTAERVKTVQENAFKRAEIVKAYGQKINEGTKNSLKAGVYHSSVPADIIEKYLNDKQKELDLLDTALNSTLQCIDNEISALQTKLNNVGTFFANEMAQLVAVKKAELKKAQEEKIQSVTKYNNSITEKSVKYANSVLKEKADLKLKFMEIQGVQLTEDQKVRRGYFSDIIRAINCYYENMSASDAFNDFKTRTELPVYLGSFYANYLYLLQTRAGF